MRDFNQCHVGPWVGFFGKAFMKRWNFKPYTDIYAPVVFFGVNLQHELINNHKGPKILITSGPTDLPDWNIVKNRKNLFILSASIMFFVIALILIPFAGDRISSWRNK